MIARGRADAAARDRILDLKSAFWIRNQSLEFEFACSALLPKIECSNLDRVRIRPRRVKAAGFAGKNRQGRETRLARFQIRFSPASPRR